MGILPGADLPTSGDTSGFKQPKIWPLPATWLRRQKVPFWAWKAELRPAPHSSLCSLCAMGHIQTPAFHGALQGEPPGPKEEPSCAGGLCQSRGLRVLHSLGIHSVRFPSWGMHLWTFQTLMPSATSLTSLPSWKWNPSALCPILCLKNCQWTSHLLLFYKYFILRKARLFVSLDFNSAALECFWAKMHIYKTFFRWSQQHKDGWFREAMQGILVHHCAGWSKCLQLL